MLSVLPYSSPTGCHFFLAGLWLNSASMSVLAAAFIWGHRNNQDIYLTFWLFRYFWRLQCYLWWVYGFSYTRCFPVQKSPGMWVPWAVAGGGICCCLCIGQIVPVCLGCEPVSAVTGLQWRMWQVMDRCHCHFHLWFNKIVVFPQDLPMCTAGSLLGRLRPPCLGLCPSLFSVPYATQ